LPCHDAVSPTDATPRHDHQVRPHGAGRNATPQSLSSGHHSDHSSATSLNRVPGLELPTPAAHQTLCLTASNKLTGNQIPEPVCGLDSPLTFPEPVSPITQTFSLIVSGFERELADHILIVINSNRSVGCLMRIDPNHD
jgi:hypothetical protein